ncbi:hypothetical protein JCM3774_002360 [Rhodotorula dairenensis]
MLSAWSASLARSSLSSSLSRTPALLRAAAVAARPATPLRLPLTRSSQDQIRMFALSPYRREQARTLSRQKELPRLPIQPLAGLLDKYIQTLKPFLLDQADREGKDQWWVEQELDKRREWARDFDRQGGLGRLLQERLKDIDRITPNNWLDDHFWIKVAYHSWRVSLVVNSNWWLMCKEDESIPPDFRANGAPDGEFTDWQVRRAANLVKRMTDFKVRLDRQEILPDSSRAGPFDMHQYTRVFGVTRIPHIPVDTLAHAPYPHPSHDITVIANDHFYTMSVSDAISGDPLPTEQLEASLWAIAEDAAQRGPAADAVGVLSGDDRDSWTRARENLLALSPANRATATAIEDSLFVLALEPSTLKSERYVSSSPSRDTPDLDAHIRVASSANGTGRNRWWDKAVQIVVENSGRSTMIGEHSPCDALIPSIVCDYALAENLDPSGGSRRGSRSVADATSGIKKLEWVVDESTREAIDHASKTVAEIASDSEGRMLWYDEYGAGWIKSVAKQPPDAYLQMALQLAYHKTHNVPTATYETASTRLFRHGRTEVIRTLSEDSWRWVKAMRDPSIDPATRYSLLSKATKAHNTYTKEASTGRGIDRQFLGMRLLLREGETHPLLDDPLFAKSQEWVLSTSGLSAGDRFHGTGFGAVYPNGYGINYLAGDKVIKFGIESKVSCPETSTDVFRRNLVEAMREMRAVCEQGLPPQADTLVGGTQVKL